MGLTSNTLPQTEVCHRVSCRVRKLNSRTLGNLATQPSAQLGSVIGIDLSVEACARDGNVGEAGVEQVWVDAGLAMNEDAFRGEALGAVTGDGVAVVEMTMLVGIEFDQAVVVEAERFVGGSKLDAFTYGELPLDLLVDADACKAAGIVGRKLSARFLDREFVC